MVSSSANLLVSLDHGQIASRASSVLKCWWMINQVMSRLARPALRTRELWDESHGDLVKEEAVTHVTESCLVYLAACVFLLPII